jgi:uncharacterized CHY-type Zn-finger protein
MIKKNKIITSERQNPVFLCGNCKYHLFILTLENGKTILTCNKCMSPCLLIEAKET